jgi:protocatechuate 3,4-dioxygenase beta subunit
MLRLARLSILPLAAAGLLGACKSGTDPEPVGPAFNLLAVSGTTPGGFVGQALTDSLAVRVVDANGRAVPSATVTWHADTGSGVLSSAQTLTNADGRARTSWTLGTQAGEQRAYASAVTTEGTGTVTFVASAAPGPTSAVTLSPAQAFFVTGETRQFVATRVDTYGNSITDRPVAWSSTNPAVATVNAQTGMVTAVAPGTAEIRATTEGKSAGAPVTVAAGGSDTFDSGSLDPYTQFADVPASWSIASGVLTATGAGQQAHLIRTGVQFTDGWVEAEMDRADEGGLVLRFRDQNNFYLLAIRDNGSLLGQRTVEIFKRVNGQFVVLAFGVPVNWPRGEVRTVRF